MLRSSFRSYCQFGKSHIIGAGSMTNVSQEALRMNARQFLRLCKDIEILKPAGIGRSTVHDPCAEAAA